MGANGQASRFVWLAPLAVLLVILGAYAAERQEPGERTAKPVARQAPAPPNPVSTRPARQPQPRPERRYAGSGDMLIGDVRVGRDSVLSYTNEEGVPGAGPEGRRIRIRFGVLGADTRSHQGGFVLPRCTYAGARVWAAGAWTITIKPLSADARRALRSFPESRRRICPPHRNPDSP